MKSERSRVFRVIFACLIAAVINHPAVPRGEGAGIAPVPGRWVTPDRVAATPGASAPAVAQPDTLARARAIEQYGNLPLSFEANQGQMDRQVKFVARGAGYTLFLTGTEAVLKLKAPDNTTAGTSPTAAPSELAHRRTGIGPDTRPATATVLRMQLRGANRAAPIAGAEELPGKSHYFIGNDPAQWHTNIPNYAKVRYSGVYPGVDLVYYGNQRQLEYDFIVAPGADAGAIRLSFQGATSIRVDAQSGDLILHTAGRNRTAGNAGDGELRFHRPVLYQEPPAGETQDVAANGNAKENTGGQSSGSRPRTVVEGRFVLHTPTFAGASHIQPPTSQPLTSKVEVGFEIAAYDRSRPLIIDPVLAYSTYLGGSSLEVGYGIAVDASGSAYVAGDTSSADFPTTLGASQPASGGSYDAFVTKLNRTGSALLYSTYLGGSTFDAARGIAVDAAGSAYVTGNTYSPDFPTTLGASQTALGGSYYDAFVTKLNPTGSALLYSTYLGGSSTDYGFGIAVDAFGSAYVTGLTYSANFPTTLGGFQPASRGSSDAFVTKLDVAGSVLLYSTYLGGHLRDFGRGIAVDAAGSAYVTGETNSNNFPTTLGAFQPLRRSGADAFVTQLNTTGSALLYSTYLGGSSGDVGQGIAVDAFGHAYVTGITDSANFPTTLGAFQPAFGGAPSDAFVTKLNLTGSALLYSTYLGGNARDFGYGIAVDAFGSAYVTGSTGSANFPTTLGAFQPRLRCGSDAFVTKLDVTGSALLYSTYLGGSSGDSGYGIAVDASGSAYVTGFTVSANFPTTLGAFQPAFGGYWDAFVTKMPLGNCSGEKDDHNFEGNCDENNGEHHDGEHRKKNGEHP
jgi:hypothetical protein